MSLRSVLDYSKFANENGVSLREFYGTENFGLFLYSYMRMTRPTTVVELGIGYGATTCFIGQALVDNGLGKCWAVDNGEDWSLPNIPSLAQAALGYLDQAENFDDFLAKLFFAHGISEAVVYVEKNLEFNNFYFPNEEIDLLFADAPDSGAEGCIDLLRYYLPKMSDFSSIFIDRASTINHSFLLLEKMVNDMNHAKIPVHLISGLSKHERSRIVRMARHCKFTLVHLTDADEKKFNKKQNSRAWIKIEPLDFMPHNNVANYF